MRNGYQARWVSKRRVAALKKSGAAGRGVILDSFNGFIIVEPEGSDLGDGAVLSPQEAGYELQPAWCVGPNARLAQARKLLGMEVASAAPVMA
jgi:hypothetical protein